MVDKKAKTMGKSRVLRMVEMKVDHLEKSLEMKMAKWMDWPRGERTVG